MRTKVCQRCGEGFQRPKRNPDVFCGSCERATKGAELWAVIYEDASGVFGLYESRYHAAADMAADAEATGALRLIVRKVIGQRGARAELHLQDPTSAWWDEQDERMNRAEYEEQTR
jgi:hypothetical protein